MSDEMPIEACFDDLDESEAAVEFMTAAFEEFADKMDALSADLPPVEETAAEFEERRRAFALSYGYDLPLPPITDITDGGGRDTAKE